MALSDRDYARPDRPAPGSRARVGRMGMVSVNTWIIIVNCAVFLVANVLLGQAAVPVTAGRFSYAYANPDYVRNATPDWSKALPISESPSPFWVYPVYLPPGQPVPTGVPLHLSPDKTRVVLGGERVWYRPVVEAYGHFSTGKAFLELQVWRFITFQFLHEGPTHLAFNMLGLWFVGGLVEDYLGRRRYLAFYLLCGLFGAIAYLLLNFVGFLVTTFVSPGARLPGLLFDDIYTPLIGASAGVFGVLMAAAYIAPRSIVEVMFVIPMRMRTAVYVFLGMAFLNLLTGGRNAGGDAAHVGGALAGAFFIRRTHLFRDFFDVLSDSRKGGRRGAEAEVDRILDKIAAEGMGSLTPAERRTLASRRGGRG
jgi:membrane associated rhomboid family serine protease